eukprot:TRINITY_DN851_c0_g4_i1.p1 TRINITY_DN851_c0_g4~~TRINITY_DN851_c0_g4_i1.p1  ORF type:complete len:374 (+),score=50.18 TRINITY_DN851_c0_g4_i1:174-1295(+)
MAISLSSSKAKRKPYTHLACDYCKDKHLKCDGRKPSCSTCALKRFECRYREERNRKRDAHSRAMQKIEDDLRAKVMGLEHETEKWKQLYFNLKTWTKTNCSAPIPLELDVHENPSPIPPPSPMFAQRRSRSYSLPEMNNGNGGDGHYIHQYNSNYASNHSPSIPMSFDDHLGDHSPYPSPPPSEPVQSNHHNMVQQFSYAHPATHELREYDSIVSARANSHEIIAVKPEKLASLHDNSHPHRSRRSISFEQSALLHHPAIQATASRRRTHSLGPGSAYVLPHEQIHDFNNNNNNHNNNNNIHHLHPPHDVDHFSTLAPMRSLNINQQGAFVQPNSGRENMDTEQMFESNNVMHPHENEFLQHHHHHHNNNLFQ